MCVEIINWEGRQMLLSWQFIKPPFTPCDRVWRGSQLLSERKEMLQGHHRRACGQKATPFSLFHGPAHTLSSTSPDLCVSTVCEVIIDVTLSTQACRRYRYRNFSVPGKLPRGRPSSSTSIREHNAGYLALHSPGGAIPPLQGSRLSSPTVSNQTRRWRGSL